MIKVNSVSAKSIVSNLFKVRDDAHKAHLSTTDYAEHIALNEFYDELLDLTDRYAEAVQGRNKTKIFEYQDGNTIVASLKNELYKVILQYKNDKDIENIIAEMIELCNKTEYLLTLK